ncbi:hypothetical protein SELMODRAFT_403920 [Selaginella moellendorffii]|uniref:Uncharacterized protein n=1 Tax=Selaginella moellendorffii TaxID=88036 RepID=D8QSZ6_SELML|nr:hypothetical protein SELMODRAFT_403920 [Selaginella moellendorffii]
MDIVVQAFKDQLKLTKSADLPPVPGFLLRCEIRVPGSFYDRLFPSSSIHFAMSSAPLHWVSKIPDAILDSESVCWNGGNISPDKAKPEVAHAYQQQGHEDLCNFLKFRAEEIVPAGGLLCMLMNARRSKQTLSTGLQLLGARMGGHCHRGIDRREHPKHFQHALLPSSRL